MSLSDKISYNKKEYKYTSKRSPKMGEVKKYAYPVSVAYGPLKKAVKEVFDFVIKPEYCLSNEHSGNRTHCKDCIIEKFENVFGEKLIK